MDANRNEAEKVMAEAENCFRAIDLLGANNLALEAHSLCPSDREIHRLVTALRVHIAATAVKPSGPCAEYWCNILGSRPTDDIRAMKQQFRKMCLLIHPDKNPSASAEGAFKLVFGAWESLSAFKSSSSKKAAAGSNTSTDSDASASSSKKADAESNASADSNAGASSSKKPDAHSTSSTKHNDLSSTDHMHSSSSTSWKVS